MPLHLFEADRPWEGVVQDSVVTARPATVLEAVYREHGERLWRSLLAFSGDPDLAGDAVAEAFAQALRRGDALKDPAAWVWRAAFRIAAGDLKARRATATSGPRSASEDPIAASDEADRLLRALARLSPKERASVVLHHYAGFPVHEVAVTIGSTSAAVRVHLSRGRKKLRTILEADDD
jgi:RNA polymerase sigma-70 factor, ECF subfamily